MKLVLLCACLCATSAARAPAALDHIYTCPKGTPMPSDIGCVNQLTLSTGEGVVVTKSPLAQGTCEEVTACDGQSLRWVVAKSDRCDPFLASLDASKKASVTSLGAKHALVCADLTQHTLTEIDQALLDCDKQHMSCKDVFSATAAAAPRPALLSEELKLSSGKAKKNPIKDAFVATVDELGADGRYNSLLAQLSGASRLNLGDKGMFTLNTRYTMSTDNTVAAEWLSQAFISHESDDVSDQYFNMPGGTTTANVISTHYGSDPAKVHEIVVIGAHMDSTSRSAATNAPGAVDNGSGTIGALLLGEAIRKANFSRTVQVVAFSGEEQGIYGSAHYVAQAAKKGDTIVGALIMDMISYSNRYFGVTIEGTTSAPIQALMKQVEGNLNLYSPALTVNLADFSFGSDHVPFQRAGIPCVLAIEQDDTNYFGYHQTTDVVANSNASQAMAILRGFGGALYDLAN